MTSAEQTGRVRTIAAWLLGLCLLLPFVTAAAFAQDGAEAAVPACCRMHGKHRCALHALERAASDGRRRVVQTGASVHERCTFATSGTATAHAGSAAVPVEEAGTVSAGEDEAPRSAENMLCATVLRAHRQRGPPAGFRRT